MALVLASVLSLVSTKAAFAESALGFEQWNIDGAHVEWGRGNDGQPLVLTYAIIKEDTSFPKARNCSAMTRVGGLLVTSGIDMGDFRKELEAAFHMWERAANLHFREVADAGDAGILIGAQARPEGRGFTDVAYKPGLLIKPGSAPARMIERSLICLNPAQPWKIGFDGNLEAYDLRYTLAHEIGHAIGLDHPSPSGQLMSFRYDERFRELQAGDVSGARHIYGAPSGKGAGLLAFSSRAGHVAP